MTLSVDFKQAYPGQPPPTVVRNRFFDEPLDENNEIVLSEKYRIRMTVAQDPVTKAITVGVWYDGVWRQINLETALHILKDGVRSRSAELLRIVNTLSTRTVTVTPVAPSGTDEGTPTDMSTYYDTAVAELVATAAAEAEATRAKVKADELFTFLSAAITADLANGTIIRFAKKSEDGTVTYFYVFLKSGGKWFSTTDDNRIGSTRASDATVIRYIAGMFGDDADARATFAVIA